MLWLYMFNEIMFGLLAKSYLLQLNVPITPLIIISHVLTKPKSKSDIEVRLAISV